MYDGRSISAVEIIVIAETKLPLHNLLLYQERQMNPL